MTLEDSYRAISQLADDFDAHKDVYLAPGYTEARVRQDFIDKFLTALGWDVAHNVQKNPFEQEVLVERNVVDGPAKRRADYAFFIAPNFLDVRLFIEAKKPFGDIATKDNYFQAVRYGWNGQTPLSALTDFEQLHILDCRNKPDIDTIMSRAVRQYRYTDYKDRDKFAEIYYLLSREAIAEGGLEKFAASLASPAKVVRRGAQRTYQTFDAAFLSDLDKWREELAKSLKNHNPSLDGPALTEITQRILDRLVFIRFLEDKLIETDRIVSALATGHSAWEQFVVESKRLDGVYNGIVFKPHPLIDSADIEVDDAVFRRICRDLSHIHSPYDFNVIPIHILGSIYERFLGKVVIATDKRARVEEKEEVRKAGGVYYTPEFIVRYIVARTVGRAIDRKSPTQIAKMRFADIACGSGSFLLGVYDALLVYHRKWYNAHPTSAKKGDCFTHEDGSLHLTLSKKRHILLNNVFGVDLDSQAVEIAQLSLYLKLLEEETTASAREHQLEFRETLLPSLGANVVRGNSIIGTDVLDKTMFPSDIELRLNPMSFDTRFRKIMKEGGFDAIVGNPPYVRMEQLSDIKEYLRDYRSFESRADLYTYFIERATTLLKDGGWFGYIVGNRWLKARYGGPLREFISTDLEVQEIVDFGELAVFEEAATFPCIVVARRRTNDSPRISFTYAPIRELRPDRLPEQVKAAGFEVTEGPKHRAQSWNLSREDFMSAFLRYERGVVPLEQWLGGHIIGWGIKTGLNEAFIVDPKVAHRWFKDDPSTRAVVKPLLIGDEIRRYESPIPSRYLIYANRGFDLGAFPLVLAHLTQYKRALEARATAKNHPWYELQQPQPRYALMFERAKIVWPEIAMEPRFTTIEPGVYLNNKCFFTDCDSPLLLGVLNSSLMWEMLKRICSVLGDPEKRGRLELRQQFLARVPIPTTRDLPAKQHSIVQAIEKRVTTAIKLRKEAQAKQTESHTTYFRGRIADLEKEIDELVFALYGLTAREAKAITAKIEGDASAFSPIRLVRD